MRDATQRCHPSDAQRASIPKTEPLPRSELPLPSLARRGDLGATAGDPAFFRRGNALRRLRFCRPIAGDFRAQPPTCAGVR